MSVCGCYCGNGWVGLGWLEVEEGRGEGKINLDFLNFSQKIAAISISRDYRID